MSRTAKTKHVMSLVGKESHDQPHDNTNRAFISPKKTDVTAAVSNPALSVIKTDTEKEAKASDDSKEKSVHINEEKENKAHSFKHPAITAIVPELINQELETVVKRFNISPTDNNLWQLTRAALEAVKPEFSLNEAEYEEKCARLRQRVIMEMTKAAIKLPKQKSDKLT